MASRISGIANFIQNKKHESQPSSPAVYKSLRFDCDLATYVMRLETYMDFDGGGRLALLIEGTGTAISRSESGGWASLCLRNDKC